MRKILICYQVPKGLDQDLNFGIRQLNCPKPALCKQLACTSKDVEFYEKILDQDLDFGIGQLNCQKPALCKRVARM